MKQTILIGAALLGLCLLTARAKPLPATCATNCPLVAAEQCAGVTGKTPAATARKLKRCTRMHLRRLNRKCRKDQTVCPVQTTTTTTLPGKTLTLMVPDHGSDLDNGWTGISHNFPIIDGSTLQYTLDCPDGVNCTGTGATGPGTRNGTTFGAPLPLLAANTPVCVVNRFQDATLTGTFNLQTGAAGVSTPNLLRLFSDVYLRTTFPEVCPKCVVAAGGDLGSTGKCSSTSKTPGATCTVDGKVTVAGQGLYLLSSACAPLGDSPPTSLDIELPLTTGQAPPLVGPLPCGDSAGPQTSDDNCGSGVCNAGCTGTACASHDAAGNCIDAKGGISQLCCSNNTSLPCFPTKGGGSIVRTGKPVVPGDAAGGVFAGTFCIAHTDSSLINSVTGLPGPGALLLPEVGTLTGGGS